MCERRGMRGKGLEPPSLPFARHRSGSLTSRSLIRISSDRATALTMCEHRGMRGKGFEPHSLRS